LGCCKGIVFSWQGGTVPKVGSASERRVQWCDDNTRELGFGEESARITGATG